MQALYTTAEVRELDRLAIEASGRPGFELMQKAGQSVSTYILQQWPAAKKILVCCGHGNNGGDGYIVASHLKTAGLEVELLYLPGQLTGPALEASNLAQTSGIRIKEYKTTEPLPVADLIVDALFGTGLKGPITGEGLQAIQAINAQSTTVIAIDIPSGLNADTGQPLGETIIADATVTFVGLKRGFYTGSAGRYCGKIIYHDLGVHAEIFKKIKPSAALIDFKDCRPYLTPRPWDMHKGKAGHVLVVGGSPGFSGAARMAGEAALRVGAGLVTVATHPIHAAWLNVNRPELMVMGINSATELTAFLERVSVLALGPGLGQSQWGVDLLAALVDLNIPKVIDADGLNCLAQLTPIRRRQDWVLSPHPGEAARLLHSNINDIQNDRFTSVAQLCDTYGGVMVLKGAGTLIARTHEMPFVCGQGCPVLSSAGTGDILTGTIAGLLAQGLDSLQAAKLGVTVHAAAADHLQAIGGDRGWLATDLLPVIRDLLNA